MSTEIAFSPVEIPVLRGRSSNVNAAQDRARGHAAGYSAGLREAAAEHAERAVRLEREHEELLEELRAVTQRQVDLLQAAVDAVHRRTAPILEQANDVLAASALELAEAILGYELRDGETSAHAALTRVLSGADARAVLAVRMNPADLEVLDHETRSAAGVTFSADASLARGDAIADFAHGYLDASITNALARARAALLEEPQ